MNQRNPAPPKEPEWRAELMSGLYNQSLPEAERIYRIFDANDNIVCAAAPKPIAFLIAAAPRKAALCEELADALAGLSAAVQQAIRGPGHSMSIAEESWVNTAIDILTKAGRAPQ